MNYNDFLNSESRVLTFMEQVNDDIAQKEYMDEYENSDEHKMKLIAIGKNNCKKECLYNIFIKIYKDALPLHPNYKHVYGDELMDDAINYVHSRCPEGIECYFNEAIKRGSKCAKRIMEAVDKIADSEYMDKELHPSDYSNDDLSFQMTPEINRRLDIINRDMSIDDLSQAIHDNVKMSAMSEITRAKKEKEQIKNLESELANDMNLTSESAIQTELEKRGLTDAKIFNPTLFQGIMIGKMDDLTTTYESTGLSHTCIFGALNELRGVSDTTDTLYESFEQDATIGELAFIESVKEMTGLSISKALGLEQFTPSRVQEMAHEYAYMK